MVSAQPEYSFWGFLLVFTGATVTPRRVRFKCRDCGQIFAETDDPERCRRYR